MGIPENSTVLENNEMAEVEELVSDQEYHYILMGFIVMWYMIGTLGTCTNIINVITFCRMGLTDSVTISFLFLSFSDLASSCLGITHATTGLMRVIEKETSYSFKVEPYALAVFNARARRMCYEVTVLTTTFLAVQRCMCVAMPLHFKGTFTKRRTLFILFVTCLFAFSAYLPMFLSYGLELRTDPSTNSTRYMLWFSESRAVLVPVSEVLTAIILPLVTQAVAIVCLFIMRLSLLKSTMFKRTAASSRSTVVAQSDQKDTPDVLEPAEKISKQDNERLGEKEARVIASVILVCTVFVVCNTPKIITAYTRRFLPGFDIKGSLFNVYLIGNCIRLTAELINSAVNIFIYCHYNTRFRTLFWAMMGFRDTH